MEAEIKDNVLILRIPLTKGTPSSTGKSLVLASTRGFIDVPNSDVKYSLNVIKKR
jgi:hypothetical protein